MSEYQLSILYEIQGASQRLRALADTHIWATTSQQFKPNVREYICEMLEDIESTARTMRRDACPPDGENYCMQR